MLQKSPVFFCDTIPWPRKKKKKKKNLWSVTSFVLFRTTHRPNVLSKISREATEAQSHKQQRLDGHSGCPWPRLSPETRPGCSGLCEAGAGNLEDGAGAAFLGSWRLREEVSPSLYSEPLLLGSADDPCHSSSHLSPLWKASLSLPLNQLPVGTGGGGGVLQTGGSVVHHLLQAVSSDDKTEWVPR